MFLIDEYETYAKEMKESGKEKYILSLEEIKKIHGIDENTKLYKILDTDNVQNISSNFVGYIFFGYEKDNLIYLNTCDGQLIYQLADVQKVYYKGDIIPMDLLMEYNSNIELCQDWDEYLDYVKHMMTKRVMGGATK